MNRQFLSLAREARGLTQTALAQATGFSQATISKLESGLKPVSVDEVSTIANVLRFPVSLFESPEVVYRQSALVDFLFRRGMSVRQRALGSICARLELMALQLKPLFASVEVQPELQLPRSFPRSRSDDPAAIAARVRAQWKMPAGPIENLLPFIEAAGVPVVPFEFHEEKIDAVTLTRPDMPPLIFADLTKPVDRLRFSLAHELGHLVMHAYDDEPIDETQRDLEKEANVFASALLVPAQDFQAHIFPGIGLDDFVGLKHRWRVSIKALVRRAGDAGFISDDRRLSFYKLISYRGWNRREPGMLKPEDPELMRDVIAAHIDGLEHTTDDLARITHLYPDEFRQLFLSEPRVPQLRVVAKRPGVNSEA